MVKYHPDTRFLTDYAAGSLPESQALCVAAHLHYCPECRSKASELAMLGGEIFMEQAPAEVSEGCFDQIMARLDENPAPVSESHVKVDESAANKDRSPLPRAIQKLTGGNIEALKWRKVGKSFRYSSVRTADQGRETSLLHIKAGGNVPRHNHHGDEITVILKGSFSDQEDRYQVGDYIVRTSGESHTPVASQDEDCLCIATLDAPIVMNNPFYRMLAPLFSKPTAN